MYFHSRAQQRMFCLRVILATVAIFAGSFLMGKFSTTDSDIAIAGSSSSSFIHSQRTRFLRFSNNLFTTDPKTTVPRIKDTVTIYLVHEKREEVVNPAYSIFKTDILQRYGSGRMQYLIREQAECNVDCNLQEPAVVLQHEPCLAVSRGSWCGLEHLHCNYPQCKTMLTNDELCARINEPFDAREYYSSDLPDMGYLPLGPRLDAWLSLRDIQQSHQFFVPPSAKRKYAFNAIFSQSTNNSRKRLAVNIENKGHTSKLPVFTRMAKEWSKEIEADTQDDQSVLGTDEYMQVLLDSIFTISPAGHSPECFRLFEAVEAGSIPVLSWDDLHGTFHPNPKYRKDLRDEEHPCKNALLHWYGAPIVVLDSWSDLYPTIEGLLRDPAALDEMQVNLRIWYDDYMQRVVHKFEDFLLDSSSTMANGVSSLNKS